MEKQREMYEEKALVLLQKASEEKSEAISRAETLQVKGPNIFSRFVRLSTLTVEFFKMKTVGFFFFFCPQEALKTAQAEAQRWESLYTELKLSSGQLRETQHLSDEQLQWLHSQVEVRTVDCHKPHKS